MPNLLHNSHYNPSLGGHAPGDVREAFIEALELYRDWNEGEPEPTVAVRDEPVSLSQVCGLLWNCTDILPGSD